MTNETSSKSGNTVRPAPELPTKLEVDSERLAERLAFYESFDRLIQENIARSGDLLRQAMTLRENASRELAEARAEMERMRSVDRPNLRAMLTEVLDELSRVQEQVERLTSRVASSLESLDEPSPGQDKVPSQEQDGDDGEVVEPAGRTAPPRASDEHLKDVSGPIDELEAFAADLASSADAVELAQARSEPAHGDLPDLESFAHLASASEPPGPSPTETATVSGQAAAPATEPNHKTPVAKPGTSELVPPGNRVPDHDRAPNATSPVDQEEIQRGTPSDEGLAKIGGSTDDAADIDVPEWVKPFDPNEFVPRRPEPDPFTTEEEFAGDDTADATAGDPGSTPIIVTMLVHGVPRAATAISLQRYLSQLNQVEGVEPREFAEGVLRLQLAAIQPVTIDDLAAWSEGEGMELIHGRSDLLELRLPGTESL